MGRLRLVLQMVDDVVVPLLDEETVDHKDGLG